MSRHLPDVNVLLALLWPRHEGHSSAHQWFAKSGRHAWATNPLTQLGVLRLLTNPAVTQGAVSAAKAVAVLGQATRHPAHEFWPLDFGLSVALEQLALKLQGHQQWTDAVLLAQAVSRRGVMVTFDSGLRELARGRFGNHLLLLKASGGPGE